jgi:hypothetical protein
MKIGEMELRTRYVGEATRISACLVQYIDHNIRILLGIIGHGYMVSMYGHPQNIQDRYEYSTV